MMPLLLQLADKAMICPAGSRPPRDCSIPIAAATALVVCSPSPDTNAR